MTVLLVLFLKKVLVGTLISIPIAIWQWVKVEYHHARYNRKRAGWWKRRSPLKWDKAQGRWVQGPMPIAQIMEAQRGRSSKG